MLLYQDIVVINKDYLDYLHSIDGRVMINHPNRKERPNVAVLLDDDGQKWAIPLSHSTRDVDSDVTYNLFNDDNQPLGHLKFNNMIPLVDGTYSSAFDIPDSRYRSLLIEQEEIINKVFEKEILTRFNKVKQINREINDFKSQTNPTEEEIRRYDRKSKFYNIINDFDALEEGAAKWQVVSNIDIYIDKRLSCATKNKEIIEIRDEFQDFLNDKELQNVFQYRKENRTLLEKKFQNFNEMIENLKSRDDQREM